MPVTTDDFLGHELEDWLPTFPLAGPPLPRWLGINWPWYEPEVPVAKFTVTNLVISSKEVQVGQSVDISCLVTNTGTAIGDYTVYLEGDFVAEQSVTLNPGESETVTFTVTPTEVKTYQATVDGLTGTFEATTRPVADIRVENLIIEPAEVEVGQEVLISVTATNYGMAQGTKVIKCLVS